MGEATTGILLVGGESSRFGSPKAHARLPSGESLAESAWALLGWCDERIAVGKGDEELPFPVLADGSAIHAAMTGVVAGLRVARNDLCLVVPVDVPALEERDLLLLASACREAAVPPSGPLPGAYRRSAALAVLEDGLTAGRLSLRDALELLQTAVVALDPEHLVNVNTPADLTRVRERAHALPSG